MYIKTKKITLDNQEVNAELQYFEETDKQKIKEIYKGVIELNIKTQKLGGRKINIPEIVSEGLFCIEKSSARFLKCSGKISSSFDCLDLNNYLKIQLKACSVKSDLTSFGPKSKWDELYLMHFFPNQKYDGSYKVYKIPNDSIYSQKVNRTETFRDQQKQGKRPRFSLMNDIIIPQNIEPDFEGNILDY